MAVGYRPAVMALGRRFQEVATEVPFGAARVTLHSRYSPAAGNGSPIIFIPGLGLSGQPMLPTARLVSPENAVLVVDLPGCGDSAPAPRRLDLAEHASLLAAWAAAIGFHCATWVGHSFGCQIAAELAASHPDNVDCLTLVSPTVDRRARTTTSQLARLVVDGWREPLPLLPLLVRDYLKAGPRAILHAGRLALRDRIEDKLAAITAPTLVVRGGRDPLVPANWAEEVTRLLPHGQLTVIPEAAHAVPYGAPHELARAIERLRREHPQH